MNKLIRVVGSALLVFTVSVPASVFAAEFIAPADESGNVVLSTTEIHKNLYTAGGSVTVNSVTQGDAFVAGGTVTIDGPVESDLFVAGGTVSMNNTVGGDVRTSGGTITINAQVGGDVLAGVGTLVLTERAQVGGDLTVGGGTVTINAPVRGQLRIGGGVVTINSKVDGAVTIRGADSVVFGPKAEVAGTIKVEAQNQPTVQDGAKIGTINFEQAKVSKGHFAKAIVLGIVISLLASLLVALAITWVAPKRAARFITEVHKRFWANAGIGVAALIIVPIISVLLLVVVVGYGLAAVLFFSYIALMLIAWILAVLWVGSYVYKLATKQAEFTVTWKVAIVGAVIWVLVKFIPVIGSLALFIVILACFGQLLRSVKASFVERSEVKE